MCRVDQLVWVFLLLTAPGLATGEIFSNHSFFIPGAFRAECVKQGEMSVKVVHLPTLGWTCGMSTAREISHPEQSYGC